MQNGTYQGDVFALGTLVFGGGKGRLPTTDVLSISSVATTVTEQVQIADPACQWSPDDCGPGTLMNVYGNLDFLDFLGGQNIVPLDYLPKAVKSLKKFSTKSKPCLDDLKALKLTAAMIQKDANTIKMVNALTNGGLLLRWAAGDDFVQDDRAPMTIDYNSLYFWQTSFGELLGTLVHEYAHFANPTAGDKGLQKALGLDQTPNTTNISKKLANDCFKGVKNP